MTANIPPSAATPSPIHIHVSLDMARNLVRSATHRHAHEGITVKNRTRATLSLFVALHLSASLACSKQQAALFVDGVVACGQANKGELLSVAVELGATLWRELTAGADQEAALRAVGLKAAGKGVLIGGCAGAQFFRSLIKPAPVLADGAVAHMAPDPARIALEELRAKFGGAKWSVE